jgi:hypothetical protein
MTMTEPLPTTAFGKADWIDYQNNWRDADASWIQDRIILRAQDDAQRNSFAHSAGGVVYHDGLDVLQYRSKAGGYKSLQPIPTGLLVTDQAAPTNTTTLQRSEPAAAGKGIVIGLNDVSISTTFKVLTDILKVDLTGVSIKTGAKTVKLTTDGLGLVSDSQITAPSLVLGGVGPVVLTTTKTIQAGVLSAASGSVTGSWGAGSASIGGVSISSAGLVTGVNGQGFQVGGGVIYGDATSIIMRDTPKTGPYVQVSSSAVVVAGGTFYCYSPMQIRNTGLIWVDGGGSQRGLGYCVSAYGADPGVGNVPEGAIWIN